MNTAARRAAIYFTALVILASYFNIILILHNNILAGGGSYSQGDWLVNFSSGLVRRGALGELILYFADILSLSPLYVVGAVQILLMTLVYASIVAIFYINRHLKYSFALMLLPTFILFWLYEGNAYYKELIGMAAFAPILIAAAVTGRRDGVKLDAKKAISPLLASGFLFAVSVAGSEINVFFFPSLAFIAFAIFDRKIAIFYSGFIGACAFASVLFTLQFPLVSNVDAMCNALLARGLSQEICTGSIAWLERDSSAGLTAVFSMATPSHVFRTLIAVAISLAVIYCILRANHFHRLLALLVCLSFFIFSPLYLVAVDWGRWINMGIYSVISLASIVQMNPLYYEKEGARPFASEDWKYTLFFSNTLLRLGYYKSGDPYDWRSIGVQILLIEHQETIALIDQRQSSFAIFHLPLEKITIRKPTDVDAVLWQRLKFISPPAPAVHGCTRPLVGKPIARCARKSP